MPQRIRVEAVEKFAELFFRVRNVYSGDLRIVVKDGDKTVASYKREHLAPGEMEHITLPKVILDKVQGDITVSVEEAK